MTFAVATYNPPLWCAVLAALIILVGIPFILWFTDRKMR